LKLNERIGLFPPTEEKGYLERCISDLGVWGENGLDACAPEPLCSAIARLPSRRYSYRIAAIGSIRAARKAGSKKPH